MPITREDLSGRTFSLLTVTGLAAKRPLGKPGVRASMPRWWNCDCRCGGKTIVRTSSLLSGATKSCGCLKGKDPESIHADGEDWYHTRKAAYYADTNPITLSDWRSSCPWLQGRGIETRKLSPRGRNTLYYSKNRLDEIKQAKANQLLIPEFPNLVPFQEAATELNWTERYLRRRMKAKRIRTVRKRGKNAEGRRCVRSYVRRSFVDSRKPKELPADQITLPQAAKTLRMSESGIHTLVARKMLSPIEPEKIVSRNGHGRPGLRFWRAEVEKYRDDRPSKYGRPPEPASLENAKNVLREILVNGKRRLRKEEVGYAAKRGVSYDMLKLAKEGLGVITERPRGGRWFWRLPAASLPSGANGQGATPNRAAIAETGLPRGYSALSLRVQCYCFLERSKPNRRTHSAIRRTVERILGISTPLNHDADVRTYSNRWLTFKRKYLEVAASIEAEPFPKTIEKHRENA